MLLLPILVLACTVSQGEAPADEEADTATESPVLSEAPATPGTPVTGDGPRLAVVLVVDQMRADYLDRFAHLFDGGFARLLASGAVFTDAHHDHAVTSTAPGHATIATGTFPATHGIVANDFFDRNEDRSVYSGLDEEAPLLGFPDAAGRSPRRLRREGLADWLKGSYSSGKVVSVALKDRSAIMMGGHRPDLAYWYRAAARGLVTSRYYADDHPAWLATLGLPVLIEEFYREGWDRSREIEVYDASREDDFPGEYREGFRTFPYVFSEREGMADEDSGGPGPGFYDFLPYTPLGDDVVFTFAMRAVQEEALGADETPDVLFIGASSADYIGHRWGPYSQEVQDYYLRLDRRLGEFFHFLDEQIGPDGWILVLSADHGATPMPEELARRGVEDARRVPSRERRAARQAAVSRAAEMAGLEEEPEIRWISGAIVRGDLDRESLDAFTAALARELASVEFYDTAFTAIQIADVDPRSTGLAGRFRRSWSRDRSADVFVHLKPNHLVGSDAASHGTANDADSHVPMVFMGPGVVAGRYDGPVRTVDLAPTMAAMLGLPIPEDLDGRVLEDVIERD